MSPDCRAGKGSLADSGTNFTLVASLKIAAAIARQMSTSRPAQLPLSSGAENPGKPWLTPHDSSPRSLTVLRVCAVAACIETAAARATITARDTRFMAKPFTGRTFAWSSHVRERPADGPCRPRETAAREQAGNQSAGRQIEVRGRPLIVQRLNGPPASQNFWRAGSRD